MGFTLPSPESPREQARVLMLKKDAIETEIQSQASILKANSCTLTSPLVDADGFPLADVDIWAVRHARVRIIELRNDLKDVMNEVGRVLEAVYDPAVVAATTSGGPGANEGANASASTPSPEPLKPFAKVDGVAPSSPASDSGLRREDLVLQFGHLTQSSFSSSSLQPLAELVAMSENRELQVKVLRAGELTTLKFTPRKGWGGRGMLGCHIVPHAS